MILQGLGLNEGDMVGEWRQKWGGFGVFDIVCSGVCIEGARSDD